MELLIKWNLELAFAEKGNTVSQEMSAGWLDASHCLWPAGDIWAAGWKGAVDLLHDLREVRAGARGRG